MLLAGKQDSELSEDLSPKKDDVIPIYKMYKDFDYMEGVSLFRKDNVVG